MDMSEQLLDKAKWAEEARRYEDMAKVSSLELWVTPLLTSPGVIGSNLR